MALKWIKDNISSFGGDSNNITINGESAGGASVLALMCCPSAKGLFQKAICQREKRRLCTRNGARVARFLSCKRGSR